MASERFPTDAPDAKRARPAATVAASHAKEPLLPRSSPLRHKVTDTFEILFLGRNIHSHMPSELQEIMFDYMSPTPLQQLAADPTITCEHRGVPTVPFLHALDEVFRAFAKPVGPGGLPALDADAYNQLMGRCCPHADPAKAADHVRFTNDFINSVGLPHYNGKRVVLFDGFVCFMLTRLDKRVHDLAIWHKRLYPA